MTERKDLRPIRNPMDLHMAIAEAAAKFPGDPEAAGGWLLSNFALDPVMAEAMRMEGERELRGMR